MKRKNLELELYRYDELVFGKVLYQSPAVYEHALKDTAGEIIRIDDFSIAVSGSPELGAGRLYIRGACKAKDNLLFSECCLSSEAAAALVRKIKKCVDEINKLWLAPDSETDARTGLVREI